MSFFEESSSETDISGEDNSVEEEIVNPEAAITPRDFNKDKANGSSQMMHQSVFGFITRLDKDLTCWHQQHIAAS